MFIQQWKQESQIETGSAFTNNIEICINIFIFFQLSWLKIWRWTERNFCLAEEKNSSRSLLFLVFTEFQKWTKIFMKPPDKPPIIVLSFSVCRYFWNLIKIEILNCAASSPPWLIPILVSERTNSKNTLLANCRKSEAAAMSENNHHSSNLC